MLEEAWTQKHEFAESVANFTERVRVWNREVFLNIFELKKCTLARLVGVQKAIERTPTRSFFDLENRLINHYNAILEREEILWFQKSRCHWVQLGDRNTSYFHAVTVAKHRRNKVTSLLDDTNVWCEDSSRLKDMALNFFRNLYHDTVPIMDPAQVMDFPRGSRLLEAQILNVCRPINHEEIKKTFLSMDPYKAPGPDGLHAKFYQANWSIVGNSVCEFILSAFRDGYFDKKSE